MRIGPLGIWEILVIVGVVLLIFGPSQLPKIARGVGKAVRSAKDFKDEITGEVQDDEAPKRKSRPNAGTAHTARSTPGEVPADEVKDSKTTEPTA